MIEWPRSPSDDWRKGFLAGIFDAEGSCQRRRHPDREHRSGDHRLDDACLDRLGFDVVGRGRATERPELRPRPRRPAASTCASSTRSTRRSRASARSTGAALKSDAPAARRLDRAARHRAPAVRHHHRHRRLHRQRRRSHNCFARPTHKYLDLNAGRDFEREIVVKVNVPEVLRAELARPSWKREHVALGTNTDPYQWVEGRYKLMRGIWEALRDFAQPVLDPHEVAAAAARHGPAAARSPSATSVSACLSVPTLDEKAWRATEPHTPHPRARLEAVAELNRAGIPTGVLIAPLMPGHQRRAGAGRADRRAGRGGRGDLDRRPSRCTCAARCATSSSTGCGRSGPTWWRATSSSTARRVPAAGGRARSSRRGCPAGGAGRADAPARFDRPPPALGAAEAASGGGAPEPALF